MIGNADQNRLHDSVRRSTPNGSILRWSLCIERIQLYVLLNNPPPPKKKSIIVVTTKNRKSQFKQNVIKKKISVCLRACG